MATLVFHDPNRVEDIDDVAAYGKERILARQSARL